MGPFLTLLLTLLIQEETSTNPLLGILGLGLVALLYFLPSIVGRHKRNSNSITLLNLFLGWTLIGWVVALVWATRNDDPVARPMAFTRPTVASLADELEKLRRLRDAGQLTEEEFQRLRTSLINQSAI